MNDLSIELDQRTDHITRVEGYIHDYEWRGEHTLSSWEREQLKRYRLNLQELVSEQARAIKEKAQ